MKAKDLFRVIAYKTNGFFIGFSMEEERNNFETEQEVENILLKWDSADALKAENERLKEALIKITMQLSIHHSTDVLINIAKGALYQNQ